MKKKMNYLVLLLTIIFMVGCTNIEDAATINKETDPKVAAAENSEIKSEKEEAIEEVVDEPEKRKPPQLKQMMSEASKAVSKVFIGISAGMAVGVPIANFMDNTFHMNGPSHSF